MALCVPVSQRPLSQEIKGSSDTDSHGKACLPGQLSMVAGTRAGNKQELEAGLTESSAPCQSPLASSCAVSGAQPCALIEPRAPLQGDGTQQSNTTRSAPAEGPGHICCPGSLALEAG